MTNHTAVGVLGATSLVGIPLLARLAGEAATVVACSRRPAAMHDRGAGGTHWVTPGTPRPGGLDRVPAWVTTCPVWTVGEHLTWLESLGIRRLVAVSSTSAFTKERSPDAAERRMAAAIQSAEEALAAWASARGVRLCLLRPTMIYDGVRDSNVTSIAAFIRRWGWFPVAGAARGLRQPVHADDVAAACLAACLRESTAAAYTLSGATPLPFRALVEAVFTATSRRPRIVPLPLVAWRVLLPAVHAMGLARGVTVGMAERMNEDLACDHAAAARDLGFRPRPFAADRLWSGLEAAAGASPRESAPS